MSTEYLDKSGLTYFWSKLKAYFQPILVSGTNIKTINNTSLLGSGNISIEGGGSENVFYGTCSTAAATAAKVATLDTSNRNFSLTTGVRVAVTFKYGNSATTPTLRVDGSTTGTAKTIGTPTASGTISTGAGTTYNTWGPYETVIFTYNGTYWVKGGTGYATYNMGKYVNQSTSTSANWRRILATSNAGSLPTSAVSAGSLVSTYFDADGPAINASTGVIYGKNYWANLDATADATLIARLNAYGWSDCIIT